MMCVALMCAYLCVMLCECICMWMYNDQLSYHIYDTAHYILCVMGHYCLVKAIGFCGVYKCAYM